MPVPEGEHVDDVVWIEYVGSNDWIALCVNPTMNTIQREVDMIKKSGARVFSLGSPQMVEEMKFFVFGQRWLSIVRRAQRPGPCLWRIYQDQRTLKTIP